MHEEIRRY